MEKLKKRPNLFIVQTITKYIISDEIIILSRRWWWLLHIYCIHTYIYQYSHIYYIDIYIFNCINFDTPIRGGLVRNVCVRTTRSLIVFILRYIILYDLNDSRMFTKRIEKKKKNEERRDTSSSFESTISYKRTEQSVRLSLKFYQCTFSNLYKPRPFTLHGPVSSSLVGCHVSKRRTNASKW